MDEVIAQGRPREYHREFIAHELVLWAKKPSSINLCEFCADKMLPPSKLSIWAKECPEFRKSYELAKCFLGNRREKYLSEEILHVKAYDLNATTYDYFLKEEKRLQSEFESSLKSQEVQQASEEHKALNKAVMDQLSSMQESARNIANSKTKTDCKSD